MRHTLAPIILLALFVACGGNGGADGFPDSGSGGPTPLGDSGSGDDGFGSGTGQDQYVPPSDSGSGPDGTTDTGGGGSCTSLKCTSDSECQSACGPVSGGIECCDTATQVCFPTSATACPVSTPPSDGGSMY
jgi:hypothetical protein